MDEVVFFLAQVLIQVQQRITGSDHSSVEVFFFTLRLVNMMRSARLSVQNDGSREGEGGVAQLLHRNKEGQTRHRGYVTQVAEITESSAGLLKMCYKLRNEK